MSKSRQLEAHVSISTEMGLIANSWALFELHANECIWALAGVQPGLGACMTAQIFNITNRLAALAALMKIRDVNKALLDELNKLITDVRSPQEKRNRAIHDPWVTKQDGTTGRIEVTAQKKLVFEIKEVPIEELEKDRREIETFTQRFFLFRNKILAALPTLPPIPELTLQSIRVIDLAHGQTLANGD